jgi:predicted enzyme related to lactoylglutathione lyase
MSERDHYPAGVPCWVSNLQNDVPTARAFYEQLFGWTTVGPEGVPDAEASYVVGRVRGRDVAGIGRLPDPAQPPMWVTEIRVDDLQATAERVRAAGGTVVECPVDFGSIGRLAVLTDPAGALFCAWEPGLRQGAQVVNEAGAWAMSALQAPDPGRAADFYGAVFGWKPEPFGPVTVFRLPGYVGGEPQQPVPRDVVAVLIPTEDAAATWGVDFWVQDVESAVATTSRLGGRVVVPPYDATPFRQAVLADPGEAVFSVSALTVG